MINFKSVIILAGYFAGKIFMSLFVARCSAGMAFVFVYVFSAELFPTALRSVVTIMLIYSDADVRLHMEQEDARLKF